MSRVMRMREGLLLITSFFLLSLLFLSRLFISGNHKQASPTDHLTTHSRSFLVLFEESQSCRYGGVMTTWGCICGEDTEGEYCNSTRADYGPLYTMDKKVSLQEVYVVYHHSSLDRKFDRLLTVNDGAWSSVLTYLSWGGGRMTWKSSLPSYHLNHLNHLHRLSSREPSGDPVRLLLSPAPAVQKYEEENSINDNQSVNPVEPETLLSKLAFAELQEKTLTPNDHFMLRVINQYGPWSENDLQVLKELTNFYTFFRSQIPPSFILREKWDPKKTALKKAKPFVIGYILLFSYARYLKQLLLLLKMIWHHEDYFVIHVDKKATSLIPQLSKEINETLKNPTNFHIFSEIDGKWGDISLVYMEVVSWVQLFYKSQKIDYVINLSSVDYPIKNYHELQDFLYSYGRSMNLVDISQKDVTHRFANPSFAKPNILTMSPPQAVLASGRLWKKLGLKTFQAGSQWHVLHRSFVLQLMVNPLMIEFLFSLKRVGIPDESYIQTAASLVAPDNTENIWTTYVQWETASHEITPDLFARIKTYQKAFFARKFLNAQRMEDLHKFLNLYPFANLTNSPSKILL